MWVRSALLLLVVVFAGWLCFHPPLVGLQQGVPVLDDPATTATLKLEFGLNSGESRLWEGVITTSLGEVLYSKGWRFLPPDRVIGKNAWELRTRQFVEPDDSNSSVRGGPFPVVPSGVFVALQAPAQAQIRVETNHGEFSISLAKLKAAGRVSFLDGDAALVYTPPVHSITRGAASHHDFPSAAASDDQAFVAWTTFHNNGNLVYLGHRKSDEWTVHQVTDQWGDYFSTAVAVAEENNLIVAWGEYLGDRWRLVSRQMNVATGKWDPPRYVSESGRRQMFPRMVADTAGRCWIAWQEFAGGNFDIFLALWEDGGWSTPIQVSESPTNDWHPSLATGNNGDVYVTWDSYDAGNYDIFLRRVSNGTLEPVVQVTQSKTYDAHPTIAVDPANRVWLAWEEAGPNWGKDVGVLGRAATALHESREIRLVKYEDGKFFEPERSFRENAPAWLLSKRVPSRKLDPSHERPHLAIGKAGFPYLFFRRYQFRKATDDNAIPLRFGDHEETLWPGHTAPLHLWEIYVTGFDGHNWLPVRQLPDSGGRANMQAASAPTNTGLLYVWPADGRSYTDPRPKSTQLRFVEFDDVGTVPARASMQPYVSRLGGTPNAAPTERVDLRRVRETEWKIGGGSLRLFRGDLHRHTETSFDGTNDGDIIDTYRYAMDAASLDFLAVTDHSFHERQYFYEYDWWRNQQIASLFNNPGYS